MGKYGADPGQQYLTGVGMTAQKKIWPVFEGFPIDLVGMGNQDGKGIGGQALEGALKVLGLKIVAVVRTHEPEALAVFFDRQSPVDQKIHPQLLKGLNDFRAIVISKHTQNTVLYLDLGQQEAHLLKSGSKGAVGLHSQVASQDAKVGGSPANYVNGPLSEPRQAVEMQVRDKEDLVAVKSGRQVFKSK